MIVFTVVCVSGSQPDTIDFAAAFEPAASDRDSADTLAEQFEADVREAAFQEDIGALFAPGIDGIDTSGWHNGKINAFRFDYKTMADTVRVALTDSSRSQVFTFPFAGHITSPFGPRRGFWHFGMDIKLRTGDSVRCVLDGIVRVIQNDRYGYGKVVVLRHHSGLETLYGHLSKTTVTVNQRVSSGEVVGLGGNTGRSTGSHLHFEVRYRGEPFDPNVMVDFERFCLKHDTLSLSRENFEYLTELRKTVYHKIRKGETLGHIARRYGTTARKICAYNGITPRTVLRIGRKIIVRKDKGEQNLSMRQAAKPGS